MSDKIIGRNPVLEAIKSGRDIDKIFIEIGKFIYENNRDLLPDEIKGMLSKIDTLKDGINELNEKVKAIKEKDN